MNDKVKNCECGSHPIFCGISRRFHCENCGKWARVNFGSDQDAVNDWNRFCAYQEPSQITASDVPESVRRELQAEALLEAAQMLQCHKPYHKLSKIEMLRLYAEQLREQSK